MRTLLCDIWRFDSILTFAIDSERISSEKKYRIFHPQFDFIFVDHALPDLIHTICENERVARMEHKNGNMTASTVHNIHTQSAGMDRGRGKKYENWWFLHFEISHSRSHVSSPPLLISIQFIMLLITSASFRSIHSPNEMLSELKSISYMRDSRRFFHCKYNVIYFYWLNVIIFI